MAQLPFPPSERPAYPSPIRDYRSGFPDRIVNWVPWVGIRGGRNMITCLELRFKGTVTVADLALNGADIWRVFAGIEIRDRAGVVRWNTDGFDARTCSILWGGIEHFDEHDNLAIGAGKVINLFARIPLAPQHIKRGYDFGLPADEFQDITITFAPQASMQTSTTTLTALTGTCYVNAYCTEQGDARGGTMELNSVMAVGVQAFTNNTQLKLGHTGRIHDLVFVKHGLSVVGGELITAITDVTSADYGYQRTTREDIVGRYRWIYGTGRSFSTNGTERYSDPVLTGVALPVVMGTRKTSVHQGKMMESSIWDVGTGAANYFAIVRQAVKRSDELSAITAERHGLTDSTPVRMKTAAKSRQSPRDRWTKDERKLLPVSVPWKPPQDR